MVSEYRIAYSDEAKADLWHITAAILENAWPRSAEKWLNKIVDKASSLAVFPEGNAVYEFDDRYRSARVGKYRIIYRVDKANDVVRVLRIVYARRDLSEVALGEE